MRGQGSPRRSPRANATPSNDGFAGLQTTWEAVRRDGSIAVLPSERTPPCPSVPSISSPSPPSPPPSRRRARPGVAELFWSSPAGIGGINLDGSGLDDTIASNTFPAQITSDGRHLYWADLLGGTIERSDLDGTDRTSIVTGLASPVGVAVTDTHVYWSSFSTRAIARADKDGGNVDPAFVPATQTLTLPAGLAVDDEHLYFSRIAATDNAVMRIGFDGANEEKVATTAQPAFFLALDDEHVYWTTAPRATSGAPALDGGGVKDSFLRGTGVVYGIAVDDRHVYWTDSDNVHRTTIDGSTTLTDIKQGVPNLFGLGMVRPQAVASTDALAFGDAVQGAAHDADVPGQERRAEGHAAH